MINNEKKTKRNKLFGISNPFLKTIMYITFVILTGGLGLIAILLARLGDRTIEKRKTKKSAHK